MIRDYFQGKQRAFQTCVGLLVCLAFLVQFLPFFTPICLAIFFSFAIVPIVNRTGRKRSRRKLPAAIVLLGFFLGFAAPLGFIIHRMVVKVSDVVEGGVSNTPLFRALDNIKDKVLLMIAQVSPDFADSLTQESEGMTQGLADSMVKFTGGFAGALPDFLMAYLVFMAVVYLLIVQSRQVKEFFAGFELMGEARMNRVIKICQNACYSTLMASMVIGFIQAGVVSLGALVFGYSEIVLVFIITFVVSFIPVIGAGPVAMLLAVNSFLLGDTGKGIGLLVVAAVAGIIDNIIKPYLVSHTENEEMHPIISILAFVGAIIVYGLPGLLLGPVLVQLAVQLVPVLFKPEKHRVKKKVTEESSSS